MTSGERRLAERLEQKRDDDYLLWYGVPVGPQQLHPDFIVLHPSRGLLILDAKDFRLSTIVQVTKDEWIILGSASDEPKHSVALRLGPQLRPHRARRAASRQTPGAPRWPPRG